MKITSSLAYPLRRLEFAAAFSGLLPVLLSLLVLPEVPLPVPLRLLLRPGLLLGRLPPGVLRVFREGLPTADELAEKAFQNPMFARVVAH